MSTSTSRLRTTVLLLVAVLLAALVAPPPAADAHSRATKRMATVSGVPVHLPTSHAIYVGYHQASYRSVRPMRRHIGVLLPPRGRGTHRTGAVDVSVRRNTPVYAPVTGKVVEVKRYRLYGRTTDYRIRIVPDANRRMLTTVLHVESPTVRVGQRVKGGWTRIAKRARPLPFTSQIDRAVGRRYPHVHVETRRR